MNPRVSNDAAEHLVRPAIRPPAQMIVFTLVFTVLGAGETWLPVTGRRRLGTVTSPWLRSGWCPDA